MDWTAFDAGCTARDVATIAEAEAALGDVGSDDFRALAVRLARECAARGHRRVGLSGGQGAGKSTLAELIAGACAHEGLRARVVGLDEFYLPRAERQAFADRVHPLFETRGAPGTHDVHALRAALDDLLSPGRVTLPVFDKGRDDRAGTVEVEGPFDVLIFEGWFVGAPAAAAAGELDAPVNALEAERDADGVWRRAADAALVRDYVPIWERLDMMVYLAVPGLDAVRRWRLDQEQGVPEALRRDAAAIAAFVAFYERVTCRMLDRMPAIADWTVRLADDHGVAAIEDRRTTRTEAG